MRYPEAGVPHVFASLIGFVDLGVAHLRVRGPAGMPQANVSYTIVRIPTTVVEKEQIGSVRKVRYPEAGVRPIFASLLDFADLGVDTYPCATPRSRRDAAGKRVVHACQDTHYSSIKVTDRFCEESVLS